MAGPRDPYGPRDPHDAGDPRGGGGPRGGRGPHGTGDPYGPHDASGGDGPFEPFEPVTGYGPSKQYPYSDPYGDPYSDPYGGPEARAQEPHANGFDHERPPGRIRRFSAVRLWAGGVAVALVAALAAAVAMLLVRGVLEIAVFAPERQGTMALASTGQLALGAALAALLTTAVVQLLLLATPQPGRFLAWIIALGTAAMMLVPFTYEASWEAKAGTAGVYLVIGVVIGTLMPTVARSASRG